jgi:hypothetical protein
MTNLMLFLFLPALVVAARYLGFEQIRRGSHHEDDL